MGTRPFSWAPQVVPTFNLFFPSWALTLTQAIRDSNPKIGNGNQIAIEAAESPTATVISFVITDADVNMRFSTIGESRHFPLAILPLRHGKTLWVVVWHRPEGNMQDLAEEGMSGLAANFSATPEQFLTIHRWGGPGNVCIWKDARWRHILDALRN